MATPLVPTPLQVQINIADPGGKTISIFSNAGQSSLASDAGQPIAVAKTSTGQVASVHGTVAGLIFSNPA